MDQDDSEDETLEAVTHVRAPAAAATDQGDVVPPTTAPAVVPAVVPPATASLHSSPANATM